MAEQMGDPNHAVVPGASATPPSAESGRDVADEDFLFHLYRGSELLQDERVHEAKEELEHALRFQPRDARGQDLLGVVYFRLGLYPRAIQIYETLRNQNPRQPSVRLNLALCYLKTQQADRAREELEALVKAQPEHKRAWGYLGVAYERTGDLTRAREAFEKSGHPHLVKRVAERTTLAPRASTPPGAPVLPTAEMRQALRAAFSELDAGELTFQLAAPAPKEGPADGGSLWRAVELGASTGPDSAAHAKPTQLFGLVAEPATSSKDTQLFGLAGGDPGIEDSMPAVPKLRAPLSVQGFGLQEAPPPAEAPPPLVREVPTLDEVVADATLPFPESPGVLLAGPSLALVTTSDDHPFAVRLEGLRSYAGQVDCSVLLRQVQGRATGEPLGGVGAPLVRVSGDGQLVIGVRPANNIVGLRLDPPGLAFVREEHLLGFEMILLHENGRFSTGDREASNVVQLQGRGVILLELVGELAAIPVSQRRGATVRRDAIVGWLGRLVPHALPPAEAPAGQRGLVSFGGDGTVLALSM
jgi:hypothetical protein